MIKSLIFSIVESKITKWDKEVLEEQYMGTKEWLGKYGLNARKLELFDVLGSVAFKHQDGAVDINMKPPENTQTDAVSQQYRTNIMNYCILHKLKLLFICV